MRKGIIYVYFNKAKYEKEGIEKYYVGQTVRTMEQRAGKDGIGYHWDDPNYNNKFANSIRKWGWNAFEGRVLEEVYEEDLDELEKFYIEYFDSFKNGYNSTLGGEGTRGLNAFANKTEKEMEKVRKKQSISQRKRWEDPEEREKTSISVKKRYEDPEEREKISVIVKKRYKDPKEREKTSIAVKKHFEDPKAREKLSIAQRERYKDPKEKEKCSQFGEKNPRVKSIYCNELNIIFSYIKLAEKYCINILNIKIGPISRVCNGKLKSSGKLADGTKLTWKYVEDIDKEILDKAEYIDSKKYEEILSQNVNDCK